MPKPVCMMARLVAVTLVSLAVHAAGGADAAETFEPPLVLRNAISALAPNGRILRSSDIDWSSCAPASPHHGYVEADFDGNGRMDYRDRGQACVIALLAGPVRRAEQGAVRDNASLVSPRNWNNAITHA